MNNKLSGILDRDGKIDLAEIAKKYNRGTELHDLLDGLVPGWDEREQLTVWDSPADTR